MSLLFDTYNVCPIPLHSRCNITTMSSLHNNEQTMSAANPEHMQWQGKVGPGRQRCANGRDRALRVDAASADPGDRPPAPGGALAGRRARRPAGSAAAGARLRMHRHTLHQQLKTRARASAVSFPKQHYIERGNNAV